jgi:hypothetical protein
VSVPGAVQVFSRYLSGAMPSRDLWDANTLPTIPDHPSCTASTHFKKKSVYLLKYLTPQSLDLTEFLIITQLVKKRSRIYALTHSHEPIIVRYPGPDD